MDSISFTAYYHKALNRMYFVGPKDTDKKVSTFIKENNLKQFEIVKNLCTVMQDFDKKCGKEQSKVDFILKIVDGKCLITNELNKELND